MYRENVNSYRICIQMGNYFLRIFGHFMKFVLLKPSSHCLGSGPGISQSKTSRYTKSIVSRHCQSNPVVPWIVYTRYKPSNHKSTLVFYRLPYHISWSILKLLRTKNAQMIPCVQSLMTNQIREPTPPLLR